MHEILQKQKIFQRAVGFPIDSLRSVDRNEMSEKYIFKAIEELIELRKEFPSTMNPWSKTQNAPDRGRILEEFSDVLLFLTNFALVWRIDINELILQIEKTQTKNFESVKVKKMKQLNADILSVPTYTTGIGSGNLNPKYIFVGMNPNQELIHGYELWSDVASNSSKVILPILESLGIKDQCYFTTVVKSTTKDNEQPSLELSLFWKDYLDREIEILKLNNPDCKIITMGNFAARHVEGSINISHPGKILHGGLTKESYESEIKQIL